MADAQTRTFGTRLQIYARLIRLDRPIGIFLLLWPTLWALWIAAGGLPRLDVLLIFVAGVTLMRSAGCAINDYADRDLDKLVQRTRERPLTAGLISGGEALMVFCLLSLLAFGLVLLTNRLTIMLSVGGLALAILYPFMKRYTYLPQVVLGAAFGWAVPMAFAAQTGEIPVIAWLLFTATVVWATIYDTMYAMVDREDDLRAGIKSTAILFGGADRFIIGVLQIILLVILIQTGMQLELGWIYYAGIGAASVTFVYQQWLLASREPAACFQAFLNNNWFGALVFAGLFFHYFIAGLQPS